MNRYFFSLLAAAVVTAPAAHAQTSAKPMSMEHGMTMQHGDSIPGDHAGMLAKLNLSAAQMTQIKTIHEKYAGKMHEMSGMGNNMSNMANMPGMNKMRTQQTAEIRAALTPAQATQYDMLLADHEKQHEAKAHHDSMDHGKMKTPMKMPMGSMPGMSH